MNNAFLQITGYRADEVLNRDPKMLQSGKHDDAFYSNMWREIEEHGHWRGEIWDRRKCGEIYPELLSINAVKDKSGTITHYVGACTDISSLKQYEDKLHHQAHHDALTGLPNRLQFQERFSEAIARSNRDHQESAVLFLDLDHFKNVNDSLGHETGDLLLRTVATRLTSTVREIDTIARFGGDEFAILLNPIRDNKDAAVVAQKLLDVMAMPFQLAGHELYVSVSIGISCYPQDGVDIEVLFKNADTAMYRAKSEGRNNYQFFSPEMNALVLENLMMSNDLRLALEREEFVLHYQPCYDLKTGLLTSAEALIRWMHPVKGMISPNRFIPLAEESGLIEPLGEYLLRAACHQMRIWKDANLPIDRVAVNLSARQFRHPDLADRIVRTLEDAGLTGSSLDLELTESMVMDDPDETARVLRRLKSIGITIAIDDFGTGYSSLSRLNRFPIDFLKIDKSFVEGVPDDPQDCTVIKAIIALAKSLGMKLIAEGVETPEQFAFLEAQGCDEGQGYLLGMPAPAEEIAKKTQLSVKDITHTSVA